MKLIVTDRDGARHELPFEAGDVLMHLLFDAELDIKAECGGSCACATCHVYIDPEWTARLPAADDEEVDMLDLAFEVRPESRLSCQVTLGPEHDGMAMTIAPDWD